MSEWKAKRFWTDVSVDQAAEGWQVLLDGRPVRTPAKAPLVLPTQPLADLVAAEWAEQIETIEPDQMPATRMANSAIDKVGPQRAEVIEVVHAYGETDLVCYRADAPPELRRLQTEGWDPIIDWAADTFGARLVPATGLMAIAQDDTALARLKAELDHLSAFQLAAMHDLVALTGSLLLGLSIGRGAIAPAQAWALSRIDEEWQIAQWGRDEEADTLVQKRFQDFIDAESFFRAAG